MSLKLEEETVILKSNDDMLFTISVAAACGSLTLRYLLLDCADLVVDNGPIPMYNVPGPILGKVVDYLNYHQDEKKYSANQKAKWDDAFLGLDVDVYMQLVHAANYMDIPKLSALSSKAVAGKLSGLNMFEIRKNFNIPDPEPEELPQLFDDPEWFADDGEQSEEEEAAPPNLDEDSDDMDLENMGIADGLAQYLEYLEALDGANPANNQ